MGDWPLRSYPFEILDRNRGCKYIPGVDSIAFGYSWYGRLERLAKFPSSSIYDNTHALPPVQKIFGF